MPDPFHEISDGNLVAAVLNGDVEQFGVLVARYQRPLWRAALSRLQRSDWADEAVQEAFLCAFKFLRTYDSRYSFRTWLWTILFNQCHRIGKSRSRQMSAGTSSEPGGSVDAAKFDGIAGREVSPPTELIRKERSALLAEFLDQLPEPQADALRLRFFGDLKFTEIADVMQCSLSTAKNRVRWGLMKMAELIRAAGDPFVADESIEMGEVE